jgi:hypothetical protein
MRNLQSSKASLLSKNGKLFGGLAEMGPDAPKAWASASAAVTLIS